MSKIVPVLTFVAGAAAGSFGAWQLLKKRYEERLEKEIASVKEAYADRFERYKNPDTIDVDPLDGTERRVWGNGAMGMVSSLAEEKSEAATIAVQNGYVPEIPEVPKHDGPYVISPDDFGEFYEYSKVYLTYFNDGVLSDNEYDMLTTTEIEQSCGYECLDHFGEYEEDTVWVRNDSKRCDYEITKDLRNYTELSPAYS